MSSWSPHLSQWFPFLNQSKFAFHLVLTYCGCVLWFVTSPCLLLDPHSPKGRVHASFVIISPLFLALNCAWRLLTWTSLSLKTKKKWFILLNWPRKCLVEKCYICISKGEINWQYIVSPEWYLENLSSSPLTFKSWKILKNFKRNSCISEIQRCI